MPSSCIGSAQSNRFFVEFGIESGREGNCVFLADVLAWSGLFIEAEEQHFSELSDKYAANTAVRTLRANVTPQNIEQLFADAGVPSEPDLLSIDIDGQDYWVWEALEEYRPRILVIEYNAVPPDRPATRPAAGLHGRLGWNGLLRSIVGCSLCAGRP